MRYLRVGKLAWNSKVALNLAVGNGDVIIAANQDGLSVEFYIFDSFFIKHEASSCFKFTSYKIFCKLVEVLE